MRDETGIYAMGTFGSDLGRVAAIARHIADAVVYAPTAARDILAYHEVNLVVPRCLAPDCEGLSASDLAAWMRQRDPKRLVMDKFAYGALYGECEQYIRGRGRHDTYYVHQRRNNPINRWVKPGDFTAVVNTDPGSEFDGLNLYPILPFEPDELPTRTEAREEMSGGDRPIVLQISDLGTDVGEYLAAQCQQANVDLFVHTTYPAIRLMPGADFVIGYAGHDQASASAVGVPMAALENPDMPLQIWRTNSSIPEIVEALATLDVRDAPDRADFKNQAKVVAALVAREDADG